MREEKGKRKKRGSEGRRAAKEREKERQGLKVGRATIEHNKIMTNARSNRRNVRATKNTNENNKFGQLIDASFRPF